MLRFILDLIRSIAQSAALLLAQLSRCAETCTLISLQQVKGLVLLCQISRILLAGKVGPVALPRVVEHICVVLHQLHAMPCNQTHHVIPHGGSLFSSIKPQPF